MKKQLIASGILTVLILVVLTGCGEKSNNPNNNPNKFIGTWKEEDSQYGMYKFSPDGTCLVNTYNLPGTYEISDGKLNISYSHTNYTFDYVFRGDNRLVLTNVVDGYIRAYTKQEN